MLFVDKILHSGIISIVQIFSGTCSVCNFSTMGQNITVQSWGPKYLQLNLHCAADCRNLVDFKELEYHYSFIVNISICIVYF